MSGDGGCCCDCHVGGGDCISTHICRSPINNGHVPAMLSRQKFKAALGELTHGMRLCELIVMQNSCHTWISSNGIRFQQRAAVPAAEFMFCHRLHVLHLISFVCALTLFQPPAPGTVTVISCTPTQVSGDDVVIATAVACAAIATMRVIVAQSNASASVLEVSHLSINEHGGRHLIVRALLLNLLLVLRSHLLMSFRYEVSAYSKEGGPSRLATVSAGEDV
jgi:hypothetical protein